MGDKSAQQRSTQWHEAKAQATKSAVISGAARVFGRVGYRDAVVSEITAESATTTGAMYHYFPSKETVALAVVEEAKRRLLALYEATDEGGSPAEQLMVVLGRWTDLVLRDDVVRAGLRLAFENGAFAESQLGLVQSWEAATVAIVNRAVGAGEIVAQFDANNAARFLIVSGAGSLTLLTGSGDRSTLQADTRSALEMLFRALTTPEHRERLFGRLEAIFAARRGTSMPTTPQSSG